MGKSAPQPPDPKDTSAAQTGTSVSTSIANAFLGNTNRVGPDGTTSYSQSGDYTWTDPYTKKTYTVPRFTETVTLSPEAQEIYDKQNAAKGNLSDLAATQSGFLKDYMAQPIDLNNEATEARLFELGSKRLDPLFARGRESLTSKLANQGIKIGSTAYDRAMEGYGQQENDAYNQLLLGGRGQAVQEALTERNQPINEITALLSGSQVSQPNFTGNAQPQIPITDNAGIINTNYQQQLAAWQANQANVGSNIGGVLGGLGGLFALSDRRAKKDISKVGETGEGLGIYKYRYKGGGPMQLGLMAQEVEEHDPGAVMTGSDGFKRVNYARALSLGA